MEQIVSENLFLIEFVVDKCIILPCAIPKEVQNIVGETCVSIQFLNNEPLNVCEEDFERKRKFVEDENVKSGKSCLFAMSPAQAEESLTEFNIFVWIYKKFTNNMLPDKTQIGSAIIPAASIFTDIIDILKINTEQCVKETVTRTLKDNFNILNASDEVIGSISIFLRLSCFGKLIVTQFQMNLEDKLVYFKDKEGKSLYKYRKASKKEMEEGDGDRNPRNYMNGQYATPPCTIQGEPCQTPCMNTQGAGEGGSCICVSAARPNSPVTPTPYPPNGGGARLCKNQALTMRGAGDPNRFGLNIGGCQGATDRNVTIVPPVTTTDDTQEDKTDPSLDVFILKINKKSEKRDRKSNFAVELITPKGEDAKPIPKYFTQETQCEGGGLSFSSGGKGSKSKGGKGKGKRKSGDDGEGRRGSGDDDDEKNNKNDKNEKNRNDDKISLPAFVGGILLKERNYSDEPTCCAGNDRPVCRPMYPCKPRNQTCCCEPGNKWKVPSNTSLYCSMGKIRSAVS